jgi:hypothetical protein
MTVSRDLSRCKVVDLVAVQVRWEGGKYAFFYRKGNENHDLGKVFFSFIRESYQQLSGPRLLMIGCHT